MKILYVIIFVVVITIINTGLSKEYEIDNIIKQKILDAGCPFVSRNQLLERTVCLMPDYALNEMPKNSRLQRAYLQAS